MGTGRVKAVSMQGSRTQTQEPVGAANKGLLAVLPGPAIPGAMHEVGVGPARPVVVVVRSGGGRVEIDDRVPDGAGVHDVNPAR